MPKYCRPTSKGHQPGKNRMKMASGWTAPRKTLHPLAQHQISLQKSKQFFLQLMPLTYLTNLQLLWLEISYNPSNFKSASQF